MSTILGSENISGGKAAIAAYRNACGDIFTKLQEEITVLTDSSFIGDASTGYRNFFAEQIVPGLTKKLTGESESVTSMLESLFNTVEQMLEPYDTELGKGNANAGMEGRGEI